MQYITVKNPSETEYIINRSRFIGKAMPVTSEEAAVAFINEQKQKYWNATHNVYAYSLREGSISRYSDDGEPSGTAGMPVLSVLTKPGITDAVIVVTRYFGGVLLGAGGLVRAYSHSASLAVNEAGLVKMVMCKKLEITCDYSNYGRVAAIVPECGGALEDTQFTDVVRLIVNIVPEMVGTMMKKLADATAGSALVDEMGELFCEFPIEEK